MRMPTPKMLVFWALAVAAPFVVSAIALSTLPPGTTEVPMHVALDGSMEMGDPSGFWLVAAGLALCNVLFAASYCANDFLYDHGLVHGVSRKGALKVYVAFAAAVVVLQAALLAFMLSVG